MDIVLLSKDLMYSQTQVNKAPAWLLTELAIEKGKELSKHYGADERLVLTSLYLAHTVFSPIWRGQVQQNHPRLSAEFVVSYLDKWGVSNDDKKIILESIEKHHVISTPPQKNRATGKPSTMEIVKNAECAKFVTVKGALIWLHELGLRGVPYEEAVDKVFKKMDEKQSLLTLDVCIKEAKVQCAKIKKLLFT
ncbi:MAG: hypothetical protein FWC00_05985 [Firmicutes bacterium]|nr:hypothetical protein [Bacillota bacterium]